MPGLVAYSIPATRSIARGQPIGCAKFAHNESPPGGRSKCSLALTVRPARNEARSRPVLFSVSARRCPGDGGLTARSWEENFEAFRISRVLAVFG